MQNRGWKWNGRIIFVVNEGAVIKRDFISYWHLL